MNDELHKRPLVTFALFSYNQERYVREAVEGAFSQDYENLEIILSDDCSSDQTFEIMKEMAAEYNGPHSVILRRNAFNLGTALHVYTAFLESSGELFIVAAGDDISRYDRTRKLCNKWATVGRPSGVVHSGWTSFSNSDKGTTKYHPPRKITTGGVLEGYKKSMWLPAAAPTVAYTRDVFEKFGPLLGGSIIEDAPLFLRAALIGGFTECQDQLVQQRSHADNSGSGYTISQPTRWNRFISSKAIAFRNMQMDIATYSRCRDYNDLKKIERKVLAVAASAPKLLLPETKRPTLSKRVSVFFNIIFGPAVGNDPLIRIFFALSFFEFRFHLVWVRIVKRVMGYGKRTY